MVARFSFLYAHVAAVGVFIAWVGIITALVSAIYGMYQDDIKKVLAYSTVSQLGYMFAGVGLAAYSAGIFHVFTHAFFKALLFLGAGSVIYAMHHEQNIWKMGGLRSKLPLTYKTMLIGSLALAGCPPFSGFFSKDEILYSALASGHTGIWLVGVLVAGMTAYYTFRMIFVVFHGSPRDAHAFDHAHEPPAVMTVPLVILAIGALFAGFLNLPALFGGSQQVTHWLAPSVAEHAHEAAHSTEIIAIAASVAAFFVGILIAWRKFGQGAEEPVFSGFASFAYHTFRVNEFYDVMLVRPYKAIGGAIANFIDANITDIPAQVIAWFYRQAGSLFKLLQVGYVRAYAIYMIVGLSVMSLLLAQSFK